MITNINNKFKIIFENDIILNIIITPGNYTPLELCNLINLLINNINNCNMTFNLNTFKYNFISSFNF